MNLEHIKYKNYNITIKQSGGVLQNPFTFYVKNSFNEMVGEGDAAYLTRELCVQDSKLCVDKIIRERQ